MVQLYLFYVDNRDELIEQIIKKYFTLNLLWDLSVHALILERQVFRHILLDNEFEFALEPIVLTLNYLPKEKQSYCIEFFGTKIHV